MKMQINNYWPYMAFKKPITQNKNEKLIELKKSMQKIDLEFKNNANNFVFNDGDINADIMLIGEAPGEEEDKEGIPFVGKSGKLLRYFLKEANFKNYYITNIIPWRPPNNRTPEKSEIILMQPFIKKHIEIIAPKIIIPVGATALKALEINESITNTQGIIHNSSIGAIFPIYHPSYALRVPEKKKELWLSLLKLKQIMK